MPTNLASVRYHLAERVVLSSLYVSISCQRAISKCIVCLAPPSVLSFTVESFSFFTLAHRRITSSRVAFNTPDVI